MISDFVGDPFSYSGVCRTVRATARKQALSAEAAKRKLRMRTICCGHRPRQAIARCLRTRPWPGIIVCASGELAKDAILAAGEVGAQVPADILIVSMFETPPEFHVPHVHIDFHTIGRLAGMLADDLLAGKEPSSRTLGIEPGFISAMGHAHPASGQRGG